MVLLNNRRATDFSVAVKAKVGGGKDRIVAGVSCYMRFQMELQSDQV